MVTTWVPRQRRFPRRRRLGPVLMGVMLAAISASLMGCGRSQPAFPLPGPAASPALNDVPAGVIVPVGQRAQGIAVDPVTGTVAVGTANPPAVILTDEAGRTRSSVALAGPASHIEGRGPGGGFLAAIESPGTVAVIGEGGGKAGVVAGVTGQPAQTASADGKVFVIDRSSSKVTVVDAAGIVGSVGIGFQPDAVATDGRRLAVVGTQERTIEVLDASNDKSLGRVPAGSGPTQVVGSNSYFYVVDTAGNRILVFASIPSVRQIASYRLAGSPYAVAIDRVHHNLWVTLTATNELAQFQVSNGALRLVDTYSTVRQPNSVAVDPVRGWVFVAGNYGGTVEIIHPPKSAPQ